ncbi:hypothetical protein ACI65C_010906 [Semiaphis heraclei]
MSVDSSVNPYAMCAIYAASGATCAKDGMPNWKQNSTLVGEDRGNRSGVGMYLSTPLRQVVRTECSGDRQRSRLRTAACPYTLNTSQNVWWTVVTEEVKRDRGSGGLLQCGRSAVYRKFLAVLLLLLLLLLTCYRVARTIVQYYHYNSYNTTQSLEYFISNTSQ